MRSHRSLLLAATFTIATTLAACGNDKAGAGPAGNPLVGARPAPADAVVLSKHTVHDAGNGGMASHTILKPVDWTSDLNVEWRPAMKMGFVNVVGALRAPDKREVRFHRMDSYTHYQSTMPGNQPTARTGDYVMGQIWRAPPSTPAAYIPEVLLPQVRPDAKNVRVVHSGEVTSVAKLWREMFAPMIQQQEQTNAQARQMNRGTGMQNDAKTHIAVPLVRIRYDEGGVAYEEEFSFVYFGLYTYVSGFGTEFRGADWSVHAVESVRALEGQLDAARPMLRTVLHSIRMTEKWHALYQELMKYIAEQRRKANEITRQGIIERGRILAKNNEEIRQIYQGTYKKQQESNERMSRGWTNAMRGVDDYSMPDGTTRSLDSNYSNVYTNGDETFIFTNNSLYEPNLNSTQTWTKVKPVTPSGGAAGR